MPVTGIDIAGVVIGVLGLAGSAAVGYNLTANLCINKDGAHTLALDYDYQKYVFECWHAELRRRHADGIYYFVGLPKNVKSLVENIFTAISSEQVAIDKLIEKHSILNMEDFDVMVKTPRDGGNSVIDRWKHSWNKKPYANNVTGTNNIHLQRADEHITRVRNSGKLSWTIRHRDQFSQAVANLAKHNDQLYEIFGMERRGIMGVAVAAYTVPNMNSVRDIEYLQTRDDTLAISCANLKLLEATPTPCVASSLSMAGFTFERKGSRWSVARYHTPAGREQRVLLEWKPIDLTLSMSDQDKIRARIQTLGALLASSKDPMFRIPQCLGLCDELSRMAYAYDYPRGEQTSSADREGPLTLSHLLASAGKTKVVALLGSRFDIAAALAGTFSLLHSSRWLHKGFRSDSVLFFEGWDLARSSVPIESLWVAGFEYSRPDLPGEPSIETQTDTGNIEVDIYRHPEVTKGYQWKHDLFSLGVVLWELAIWRPLHTKSPSARLMRDMSSRERMEVLIDNIDLLGGVVGAGYRDAVRCCLTGDLGTGLDDSEMARAFLDLVVMPLQRTRA